MLAEFVLTVLYSQIVVSVPGTPVGGLIWTEDHVAQGFAWSDGFVAFGLPDHDGQVAVSVETSTDFEPDEGTLWAVRTPLVVGELPISIGTIGSAHSVLVPAGTYNLVFEARSYDEAAGGSIAYDVRLHLIPSADPGFEIVRQGDELETDLVLTRSADPA